VLAPRDRQAVINPDPHETVGFQAARRQGVARVRDVVINAAPENLALIFKVEIMHTKHAHNHFAANAHSRKVKAAYLKPRESQDEA
jgi:hypothetical protein